MTLAENNPYTVEKGILYLGPDRKEQLDVYSPALTDEELLPCIIIFHTDGRGGRRCRNNKADIAMNLVANGYIAILAETAVALHSVANWNESLVVPGWPNNLYDCKTAVRYAKKLARTYRIDPERIGIIGGHLALLAAFTAKHPVMNQGGLYQEYSSEVQCVVDLYGVADLLSWTGQGFEGVPLASASSEQTLLWEAAGRQSDDVPPMLIVHGAQESETDIELSFNFIEQLKESSLARQFVAAGSSVGNDMGKNIVDLRPIILQFLNSFLKKSD
ncbi:alpha/beta hydrolase [Paenibacillus sp. UNC451MF]|uniref:alpha/beta hydrolase n=1 Tax=Paenibacillus sp. UNC451MF TaxID=1449063 RepID=UPI00048AB667|nr:alpha/beta hydrolase [Paenibacillus sp. UNC451MF]